MGTDGEHSETFFIDISLKRRLMTEVLACNTPYICQGRLPTPEGFPVPTKEGGIGNELGP